MNTQLKIALTSLALQIKSIDVKCPASEKPHKIRDDNQSIKNGVINEECDVRMRGEGEPQIKRKRGRPRTKWKD
jgi:hypothetical protein